jgi:hypothetical protein
MIVTDFDVVGISVDELKTDAPLVIDGDRVLPLPMTIERVEPITWRDLQVVQPRSQVDILQLTRCPLGDIRWEPFRPARDVQLLGAPVRERLDHVLRLSRHVTLVKWYLIGLGWSGPMARSVSVPIPCIVWAKSKMEIFLNGAAGNGATLGNLSDGLLMFKVQPQDFFDFAHG